MSPPDQVRCVDMAVLNTYFKQPTEVLRLSLDYSRWLNQPDERLVNVPTPVITVLNSTTALPSALEVTIDSYTANDSQAVDYVVAGGESGIRYTLIFTATTTLDEVVVSSIGFRVDDL